MMLKIPFLSAKEKSAANTSSEALFERSALNEQLSETLSKEGLSVVFDAQEALRIPQLGRVIILANDPLPGISTLALLYLVSRVRQDLLFIGEGSSAWLDDYQDFNCQKSSVEQTRLAATEHLANEGILILQPVHFGRSSGVPKLTQERWPTDFVKLAKHTLSPLLHIHVSSDEQPFLQQVRGFYRGNEILQKLASRVLPSVYDQKLVIGELIDAADYKDLPMRDRFKAKLLRKQLYRVAAGKISYFKTLPAIAIPESREDLLLELSKAELLGETKDQKLIYLCRLQETSPLLREIGRLREQAFRLVGEGSGKACDVDEYDLDYQHIVLWDAQDKEVVGAYRLRETFDLDSHHFYTSTLFNYLPGAERVMSRGVELGRSFVQPKYWGSRSLDYLWAGIAAFIRSNPRVRYLLGAVSISNAFSQQAKDLLLGYYSKYYLDDEPIVRCKRPYMMGFSAKEHNARLFDGLDAKEAFVVLREQLGLIGHSVPTLYKQYTELCDDGGTRFHGFNIDPDFQDCIDGLVVVDLSRLKPLKRKRYELEHHDFMACDQETSENT